MMSRAAAEQVSEKRVRRLVHRAEEKLDKAVANHFVPGGSVVYLIPDLFAGEICTEDDTDKALLQLLNNLQNLGWTTRVVDHTLYLS